MSKGKKGKKTAAKKDVEKKIAQGESSRKTSYLSDAIYAAYLAVFLGVTYHLCLTTTPPEGSSAPFSWCPAEGNALFPYLKELSVEKDFDAIASASWSDEHLIIPVVGSIAYMVLLINGREYMKDKKPQVYRWVLIVWNLSLALFSTVGAWRMIPFIAGHLKQDDGFHILACAESGPRCGQHGYICFWLFVFCYSKLPEMVDTLLMIWNKKQVIFLHWFHHITVMWFCYISWVHMSPAGTIYAGMNFTVHACMYMWYALAAARMKPASFSMAITILQIAQMLVGCGVSFLTFYWNDNCENHWSVRWYGIIMYGSYLLLFVRFFLKAYCCKAKKPDRKRSWDKSDSRFVRDGN